MRRSTLTRKPRVPALVHAATLSLAAFTGCGDDGSTSTDTTTTTNVSATDQHPTACHDGSGCGPFTPPSTSDATLGDTSESGDGTAGSTSTAGSGATAVTTESSSGTGTGTGTSTGSTSG